MNKFEEIHYHDVEFLAKLYHRVKLDPYAEMHGISIHRSVRYNTIVTPGWELAIEWGRPGYLDNRWPDRFYLLGDLARFEMDMMYLKMGGLD